MCLVLYIGSDADFPLLEPQDFSVIDHEDPTWPSKVVPFSVQEIAGDEKVVAKHFDTKFVRYAGSFEGCGCGANASYSSEWDDSKKLPTPQLFGVAAILSHGVLALGGLERIQGLVNDLPERRGARPAGSI